MPKSNDINFVHAGNAGRSATDAELVLAARRGDKRAFVEIVARSRQWCAALLIRF
jgi:hypothetical protein